LSYRHLCTWLTPFSRSSSNIIHPRAWIHSQFSIANIASAILVSSNPTNLVLAGAFNIKFINYTANMIVPVIATAIVLFPFLLYIVFADESLIPLSIKMHELSEEEKAKKPVNPNIPFAKGAAEEEADDLSDGEQRKLLSLEEIMNPFLDKGGAAFGAVIMTATLVTVLALNAASESKGEHPVFWVTLPGAFVMFCWDLAFGWIHRHETREFARKGREEVELARAERAIRQEDAARVVQDENEQGVTIESGPRLSETDKERGISHTNTEDEIRSTIDEKNQSGQTDGSYSPQGLLGMEPGIEMGEQNHAYSERVSREVALRKEKGPTTLVSLSKSSLRWLQETFPTVSAVVAHLPFALVPFAFTMFVLVQGLVTKGWVQVFAYGWDHWVEKTGTVGAIGGMGFLSVILCNVRSSILTWSQSLANCSFSSQVQILAQPFFFAA
jgi:Na+/H+ antiporter NhaD/arsenite permease-like protein